MKKALIALAITAIIGIVGVHFAKNAILGGASVDTKGATPDQQVTQSVTSNSQQSPSPVFSNDVQVVQIQYFDNKTWLVAMVNQKSAPGNIAYIIMQLVNGKYQTVAGPGTDFGGNLLPNNVPADVQDYLNTETGN